MKKLIVFLCIFLQSLDSREIFSTKAKDDPLTEIEFKSKYGELKGQKEISDELLKEGKIYGRIYLNSYNLILKDLFAKKEISYKIGDLIDNPLQIRFKTGQEILKKYKEMYQNNFQRSYLDLKEELKEKEHKEKSEVYESMKEYQEKAGMLLDILVSDFIVSLFLEIYDEGEGVKRESELEKIVNTAIYDEQGIKNKIVERYDLQEASEAIIREIFIDQMKRYTYFYRLGEEWTKDFCDFGSSGKKEYEIEFYVVSRKSYFDRMKDKNSLYEETIYNCLGW